MSVAMRTPSRQDEFIVSDHGCEVVNHRNGTHRGWFEPGTNSMHPGEAEYPAELRQLRLKAARGTRATLAPFAAALLAHSKTPQKISSAVNLWYTEHQAVGGRSPKTELTVCSVSGQQPGLTFRLTVRPTALSVQTTDFRNDDDRYWRFAFVWSHAAVSDALCIGSRITSAFPDDLLSLCRIYAAGDLAAPLIDWVQEKEGIPELVQMGIATLQQFRNSTDVRESYHTNRRATAGVT